MLHTFYRTILPVVFVALPINAASAASFSLPADATISVEKFIFPESAPEQNLSAMLHDNLAQALRKAGFSVDATGANENAPMTITPISENSDKNTPETPPLEQSAPEKTAEDGITDKTDSEETVRDGITEVAELTQDQDSEQAESRPGKNAGQNIIQGVFAAQVIPAASSVYRVAGNVTLLRENIGSPTRIGSGIGIRAESIMHCAYRVEDVSGNVLISSTASCSAARLISNTQNIDTVIASLNEKVVLSVAEKIASGLSGMEIRSSAPPFSPSKTYYEDSPGKRLKQN